MKLVEGLHFLTCFSRFSPRQDRGFTLLEVLTTLVVISILSVIGAQAYSHIVSKAYTARCQNNLRNLYAAAASYVTDQGSWPQIPVSDLENVVYLKAWIEAYRPYKLDRVNWICPGIQKILGSPNYEDDKNLRIDYIPTPFGSAPTAPYQWPSHPWFVERGNAHGDGNLIIFTSGQIKSLMEVKREGTAIPLP